MTGFLHSFEIKRLAGFCAVATCLILLVAFSVPAQKFSGQLTGTVLDPQGSAIAGATVTVTQPATGTLRTVTTSSEGNYSIPDLPIGIYKVVVTQSGFKET